jgi:C4-dicarboxylate transporter DctM subunit
VLLLVIVVLGGIYGGVFTATEGAGIGAAGAFLFALARRALTWKVLLRRADRIGPHHRHAVHAADRSDHLCQLRQLHLHARRPEGMDHPPGPVAGDDRGAMMVIYVLLGTVMEELTMVLLTIPLFFPIVVGSWALIRSGSAC